MIEVSRFPEIVINKLETVKGRTQKIGSAVLDRTHMLRYEYQLAVGDRNKAKAERFIGAANTIVDAIDLNSKMFEVKTDGNTTVRYEKPNTDNGTDEQTVQLSVRKEQKRKYSTFEIFQLKFRTTETEQIDLVSATIKPITTDDTNYIDVPMRHLETREILDISKLYYDAADIHSNIV